MYNRNVTFDRVKEITRFNIGSSGTGCGAKKIVRNHLIEMKQDENVLRLMLNVSIKILF